MWVCDILQKRAAALNRCCHLAALIPLLSSLHGWAQDQTPLAEAPPGPAEASSEVEASPAPRPPVDLEQQRTQLLAREVEARDLQWLQAGDEKFMALWSKDKTGTPYGAVLILPASGGSPDSPYTTRALRENLNHHGWATLAIALPAAPLPNPPPRTAKAADSAATQPVATMDLESLSDARLQAAFAFLHEQGQYNVVIVAIGDSALRALRFINTLNPDSGSRGKGSKKVQRAVRALVLVDARNTLPGATNMDASTFIDLLNDPELPVADIHFDTHHLDSLQVAERKRMARDAGMSYYYQIKLLRPVTQDALTSDNTLTRRIRGFLSQHAKGVEVERSKAAR